MSTSPKRKKSSLLGQTLAALFLMTIASYGVLMAAGPELRTRVLFRGPGFMELFMDAFHPLVPVWTDLEPGIRMELDPYDLVSRELLKHHEWETDSIDRIQAHLPQGGVFVDVGAHIGYYSLKAAKKVGPGGTVLSVEPNPETLKRLNANVKASEAGSVVKIQPFAASDKEGTLEFFAAPRLNTGESSLSKANASQEGSDVHTYQVHARLLDDIVEESGITRLDVIKIDVEGADFMVLKGAERTLNRFHPVLYVETVDKQLKEMGSSVAELRAFVEAHGYKSNVLPGGNTEFIPVR